MVTAAFEEERRRRAQALRDDLMAGAGMISGGVAAFGAGQDKAAKTKADLANVAADNARADAAEARAAATAKAAAEDRAADNAERAAARAVLVKKGEAADAAVLRKKQVEAAKAARDTLLERARGGASFESVRDVASEDEALGEWDDSNVQSLYDEVEREKAERAAKEADAKQKTRKTESEITRNEAAAAKALRAPAGPKPIDPQKQRILDLTEEEKRLNVAALKGEGKPSKILPAEQTQELVDIAEAIAVIDDLAAMKGNYNTGPMAPAARGVIDFMPFGETFADAIGLDQSGYNRFSSKTKKAMQLVGKLLEGGKLAEGDAKRYATILASPSMEDATFNAVLADMKSDMLRLQQNSSGAFAESFKVPTALKPKPAAAPKAPSPEADPEIDELPDAE